MKNLKKLSLLAASALLAVAFLAAGCGSDSASSGSSSKNTTVTVGATPVPHGEILNEIKPLLAKEGGQPPINCPGVCISSVVFARE